MDAACEALISKKGEDLMVLDVRGLSSVTDYFVIVTGGSAPQLRALSSDLERTLKEKHGTASSFRAGDPESGWMVVDYFDVVFHIFSREKREYYDLERLWRDAPRLKRYEG
ncbi:MAG: ribosome silencing factor [Kiritimatiellia bacterium]